MTINWKRDPEAEESSAAANSSGVDSTTTTAIQREDFYQLLPERPPTSGDFSTHLTTYRSSLYSFQCPNSSSVRLGGCPYPLYTPPHRLTELTNLHTAFHTALLSLIQSWWSTPSYHSTIQFSPKIERVLRHLDTVKPYTGLGSIRPDFLIPDEQGKPLKICEVNGRFAFNGFLIGAYSQKAMFEVLGTEEVLEEKGFVESMLSDADTVLKSHELAGLFDPTKPIGLLCNRECNVRKTSTDFWFFHQKYSNIARVVNPAELALVPDAASPSGFTLSDSQGVIEQFALECYQSELEALDEDILCELGRRCFNDLRTVFLVHDKRLLGLLRQELPALVSTGKITKTQADILEDGVAETYLPGSQMFKTLLTRPQEKGEWMLKKCTTAKGEGIIFGKDLAPQTWQTLLSTRGLAPKPSNGTIYLRNDDFPGSIKHEDQPNYILQRYCHQRRFPLIVPQAQDRRNTAGKRVEWYVIGTMVGINGWFMGVTSWRTNMTDIVAINRDGYFLSGITGREWEGVHAIGEKQVKEMVKKRGEKGA